LGLKRPHHFRERPKRAEARRKRREFFREGERPMKKVVITGATGFIGGALAKRLLNDGVKVYGVGRNEDKLNELKKYGDFVPVVADFEQYFELPRMIADGNIDVFYHFAWQGVFGESFKDYSLQLSNAKYACDTICQAIKMDCEKFVYAQTYNFYEIKSFINNDVFEPRYTCVYSSSKTAAELIMKTLAFNNSNNIVYSSGAVCMAYGEGNYSQMLTNVVIKKILNNESPDLIEGNNLYDMIYVSDIAAAFEAIGKYGINQKTYYIGHRQLRTFKEWLVDLRDAINPAVKLNFGSYKDNQNIDYSLIDLDALYNDTGFEAKTDFAESIIKTADWLKSIS
jgi:nucleoside-diphosphate-sugar epimerase